MTPTVRDIIDATCSHYLISADLLVGPCRQRSLVAARHAAFWAIRELTSLSTVETGQRFGGRDHTTVIHGLQKLEGRMSQEHREAIEAIMTGAKQRAKRRSKRDDKFIAMSSHKFTTAAQALQ